MEFDKSLIGGSTVLLILSLLKETDRYGYEIIRELESRSDKAFQLKEGTIYPVLHKLENDGYVKSYKAEGERGRARKYYEITRSGEKQLAEEMKKWNKFSISVNKIIGGELYASY